MRSSTYKIKAHPICIVLPVVLYSVLYIITGSIIYRLCTSLRYTKTIRLLIIMAIVAAISCLINIIHIISYELILTKTGITGKTGFFTIKTMNSPLSKIDAFTISSGVLGRILDYGTIRIVTTNEEYIYYNMSHAEEFKEKCMRQLNM